MKLHAIAIAIVFAGFGGAAAARSDQTLPPIDVSGAEAAAVCKPPSDAPACGNFHRFIRANFSAREIGMLFGAETSYPEYLTGGIDRLQQRYQLVVQEYVAARSAATEQIAAK